MVSRLHVALYSIAASLAGAAVLACGSDGATGPGCKSLPSTTVSVTSDVACGILHASASKCPATCGDPAYACNLPDDYLAAVLAANPDASAMGTVDSALTCPTYTGDIEVSCSQSCVGGRRTAGGRRAGPCEGPDTPGRYFARCAALEAGSVPAFRRMRAELLAHGAPGSLVLAARRAEQDELRHARVMTRLARRHGAEPAAAARAHRHVRALLPFVLENAVEGCAREAFGAALAHHQALAAQDAAVRRATRAIARDETRHAALSLRVMRWAMPRLGPDDRGRVRRAMDRAWEDLDASLARSEVPHELRRIAGVPSRSVARHMAAQVRRVMEREVWT